MHVPDGHSAHDSGDRPGRRGRDGGGIADFDGFTELRDRAAIVHNVARRRGGGWFSHFANGRVCSAHVRVSPNDPDDPPDVVVERC